jgi:hypothetical protein
MVSSALVAVVVALAPVTLGRYPLTDHLVWALSSVAVLVGWLAFLVLNVRTPEYRTNLVADFEATRSRPVRRIVDWAVVAIFALGALLPPIVILLGAAPELELALYFTAVVMALLMAAALLLGLVFEQRGPASA